MGASWFCNDIPVRMVIFADQYVVDTFQGVCIIYKEGVTINALDDVSNCSTCV